MSDSSASAGYQDPGASPSWRERKNLLIAGGVGAFVVVALGGYFLLFSGSSGDTGGGLVANANHPHAGAASPSAAATATLPAVYKADPYGNPFAPIYAAAPTATATDQAAAGAVGAAGVAAPAAGSVPVATQAPVTPAPATTKSYKIKLVKVVDDNTVTVSVNGGKAFATDTGVTFDSVFSLANTRPGEGEATFNYGDGEPFTLSTGQSKTIVVAS